MSWITNFFTSSVGKKVIMSITGIFLCTFLAAHMSGNFLLLKNDGGQAFNEYAKFMSTFPLIRVLSIVTFIGLLFHAVDGIWLVLQNRKARPVKYHSFKGGANSSWTSRNMGLLGVIILFFLIVHLKSFWFEMKFGTIQYVEYGGVKYKDLYSIVVSAFSQWWYVLLYIICLIALSLHLMHGFQSAFQTLGLNHKKYTPIIKGVGLAFSILVPLGFAIQPIYVLLKSMNVF